MRIFLYLLAWMACLAATQAAFGKTTMILNNQTVLLCGATEQFIAFAKAHGHDLRVLAPETDLACEIGRDLGIKDKFTLVNDPATYQAFIESFKKEIKDGVFKAGDQVVYLISAHGGSKLSCDVSHKISANHQSISNDTLIGIRDELKKIGVKFAILDGSCFSGNSLDLADDNTCVISSQDAFHMADADSAENGNFFEYFLTIADEHKKQKKSTDLESVFLDARVEKLDFHPWAAKNWPQISSEAGNKLRQYLSPIFVQDEQFSRTSQADIENVCVPYHDPVPPIPSTGDALENEALEIEKLMLEKVSIESTKAEWKEKSKMLQKLRDLRIEINAKEKSFYLKHYRDAIKANPSTGPCSTFQL